MKRIFALIICACLAFSLAACGENKSGSGETIISKLDSGETGDFTPVKAIKHGRVSGNNAPDGWTIRSEEGGDFITYIQMTEAYQTDPDECPFVQISCDEMSAEDLFNSVLTLKDSKGEIYATDSVTIGENIFLGVFVEDGENSLFGTVGDNTMVINYKGDEIDDPVVQDIIGGIEIAPEK